MRSLFQLSKHESHRRKQQARVRVLEACSTYDYQTTWRQIRKLGNSTLLGQTQQYQDWKARDQSCTLVCAGKLGLGKSVLLANIVDDLNLDNTSPRCPVAYFFCRHDIPESLKAGTIIWSLLQQLLQSLPDLTTVEEIIDQAASTKDTELAIEIFRLTLPRSSKAYFVFDGLDECDSVEVAKSIAQLRQVQDLLTLSICISSRLEADNILRLDLKLLAAPSTVALPEDNPDIGDFINKGLIGLLESGKLSIGDPALILEIEDALLRGSEGMFLWVALQLESLCTAKTDEAIRQALFDLPKGLSQTFSRILEKAGELGEDYQTRTLALVMAAHRPLTTNELREALSVIPGDASWDPARLLNNVYSALACCGCLITVDEEDDTVRMVHHSLKRFLLGQSEDSSATTPRLTEKEANIIMGEIVITYLNYGVFDTQLSSVAVPQLQHLAQTAPERVISSVRSSSYARRLALHLLQSRKKPEFNLGQVLAEAHVRFAPRPIEQYHFVSYAKQYVARHIRSVDWNQDAVRRLVFRLWANGSVANSTPEDMAIFLHMAALYGEGPAVKALLDSGANIEACDITDGSTPLTMAAATGHEAVVRLLLDSGANIEAKDTYNRTPLFRAVARGHDAVVKLLLDKGAEWPQWCFQAPACLHVQQQYR